MSTTTGATGDTRVPVSPELRAEAAAWIARLHGSGRTAALEAALGSWLAADPAHARAFELATHAWELGGAVSGAAVPRVSRAGSRSSARPAFWPGRREWRRPIAATLAMVLLASIGADLYFSTQDRSIATSTGEQRTLVLEDGSRVTLNTNTRLLLSFSERRREVTLQNGEAFFDVTKDVQRPFIVTVGGETVEVLGTSFAVRQESGKVDVMLVEGSVSVTPSASDGAQLEATPAKKVLTAGQRLRVGGAAPVVDRPDMEAVTAWRRGEIVLDHTSLADAIDEMNRYSDMKLVLASLHSNEIKVSGIFRAGDSRRFAKAIAATYGIDVVEEPKRLMLTPREH